MDTEETGGEMNGLLIIEIDGWEVWCGADGDNIINAHLIGSAPTRAEALAKAEASLRAALAELRAARE